MSICLCNLSADAALEILAQKHEELEPAEQDLAVFLASATEVTSSLGGFAESLPKPLDLLVGSAERRRPSRDIACHIWRGPVPQGSILRVDKGLYVTSPEFTLLQQASQLHQVCLCQMLGRYLGTWSPLVGDQGGQALSGERKGQGKRAPLATFESLKGLVERAGSIKGTRNLALAMAYTCEGAASAPETDLQLVLSLPPEFHGFSLPCPSMNYEVELSTHARSMCGRKTIRIDLCWPDYHFGLEYQGEDHGRQLGQDYARWFAAREMGYELWFVAKEQLADSLQMDYVGREVARRLGIAIDEELWPSQSNLQELLDTLTGHKHPKPVGYYELRNRQAAVRRRLRNRA